MSKKFLLMIITLSFLTFFGTNLIVSNYVDATLLGFKWTITDSKGAVVKVKDINLDTYKKALKPGYEKWNDSNANLNVSSTTSVGAGVISVYEYNQSMWTQNGWGTGEAWAQPLNSNAYDMYCFKTPFDQPEDFSPGCNKKVNQGIIWLNSSAAGWFSNRKEAVIAHEIGHIIGLAHRKFGVIHSSIMLGDLSSSYDVTSYDVSEVNSMY